MSQADAAAFAGPGPEKLYRDALEQERFQIQRCRSCGKHVFYPRALCPHCGSTDLEWVAASGRGTVYSTTVIRRRKEEGGDYNVALIDFAEGPRMMSRVEGVAPTEVKIGMAVTARIVRENGQPVVVWDAAPGART
jgi:uncharacterized OB-fold protein